MISMSNLISDLAMRMSRDTFTKIALTDHITQEVITVELLTDNLTIVVIRTKP